MATSSPEHTGLGHRVEVGVIPLPGVSNNSQRIVASYPLNFKLCWFRGLRKQERKASTRDSVMVPLKGKLRLTSGPVRPFRQLTKQAKKRTVS